MMVNRSGMLAGLLAGLVGFGWADGLAGQEAEAPPPPIPAAPGEQAAAGGAAEGEGQAPPARGIGRESILGVFRDSNPMLWPLALCSVVTVGFTLERFVALRRRRVVPRDFVERFIDRLAAGKLDRERALELCRAHDSVASRIFGHAVRYWGQPAAVIRQAVDADAAGEVADMKRNVRALNGTATLAPLLGLLGTVIGLIEAFDALGGPAGGGAAEGGPRGEALAHGISLALVATAIGLVIAIFSVVAYFYLLSRVDVLVRDLDEQARRVIELISAENAWAATDRRAGVAGGPYDRPRAEGRSL
jgi:biopolymer transport protein ExbB